MTGAGKIAAALALVLALVFVGLWASYQQSIREARVTAAYNAAIAQQKAIAGMLLATETQKAANATKALHDAKIQQEKNDSDSQRTVAALAARLRAASPAGRLRDPGAAPAKCGGGGAGAQGADPTSPGNRAGDAADGAGLLSKELTGFLLSQAASADKINIAYASCRPDALNVREALK